MDEQIYHLCPIECVWNFTFPFFRSQDKPQPTEWRLSDALTRQRGSSNTKAIRNDLIKESHMKISRQNLTQRFLKTVFSLLLLSLAVPAQAQVDCSQRVGGGLLFNFQGDWCNETAADSTGTQTGVTCRACLAEKIGVHPAAWAKGGNANCSNFSKVMVLDFPAPVADVQWMFTARERLLIIVVIPLRSTHSFFLMENHPARRSRSSLAEVLRNSLFPIPSIGTRETPSETSYPPEIGRSVRVITHGYLVTFTTSVAVANLPCPGPVLRSA